MQNLDSITDTVEYSRPLAKKMVDHLIDIGRTDLLEVVYENTKKELKKESDNLIPLSPT